MTHTHTRTQAQQERSLRLDHGRKTVNAGNRLEETAGGAQKRACRSPSPYIGYGAGQTFHFYESRLAGLQESSGNSSAVGPINGAAHGGANPRCAWLCCGEAGPVVETVAIRVATKPASHGFVRARAALHVPCL